jgi:hypothetical protein
MKYLPRMEESRSAACVGGRIKVVSMVGLLEGWNAQQFRLTTWTLSSPDPDLSGGGSGWQWQEDGVFPLEDLWATEEYRALGLPPRTPLCPVLSAARDEDGVVYAVVNDIEERDVVQQGIPSGCSGNRAQVQTPVCAWHRRAPQQDRLHQLWCSAGKPGPGDAPPPISALPGTAVQRTAR